ncbi:MAG: hypothetical protein ACEY3D_08895 [Rickettsia sp.]|uniref:hypothetical protein n=1 Tax=Rickettsia sp. TaxID=789 RepID=UPI0039793B86
MSSRGLTAESKEITKNTNNISIFNWIPRSSRGMTHYLYFYTHSNIVNNIENTTTHQPVILTAFIEKP